MKEAITLEKTDYIYEHFKGIHSDFSKTSRSSIRVTPKLEGNY